MVTYIFIAYFWCTNHPLYVKNMKRNLLEQIEKTPESVKNSLVNHANYDLENKDLRNILSHCRLKEFH